jgi:hypothetical protein
MSCNEVYSCSQCGTFFGTKEDFDLHHNQKGHEQMTRLKPLFAAELEGTGKGLAFFEIYDDTAEPQGHKRM